MYGIVVIDKPKNLTSRDVVDELCKIFNTKKVGHTGTLDPLATGVLVCTIGKYTRLNEILTSTYKEYIAEAKLGIITDSYDIDGNIIKECKVDLPLDKIKEVFLSFKKVYEQEVPIYSSVKVNGKKLYEYARENKEVELPKREVDIKELEILNIENNIVTFKTLVSKGTYIRSLINDIGEALKCGAIMVNLRRTKQGKFSIEDAYTLEDIKNNNFEFADVLKYLDMPIVEVDDDLYDKIKNGSILENTYDEDEIIFAKDNEPVAIYKKYEKDIKKIKPRKVF